MYNNNLAKLKKFKIGSQCSRSYINSYCLENLDKILTDPPPTFCINDTEENPKKRKFMFEKI